MSKQIKKYLILLNAFFLAFMGASSSFASISEANGQWQYIIKRGDTSGQSLSNPNCPFYIGYFSLDIRKATKYKDGFYMEKNDIHSLQQSENVFVMSDKNYEVMGSYTPENRDDLCENPLTKAKQEKAPLKITKISSDGKTFEWFIDFKDGNGQGNAIWAVKAELDGQNKMRGNLKAYMCSGEKLFRKCKIINNAKFTATKIKSIRESSGKPLIEKQISLSTFFKLFVKTAETINTKPSNDFYNGINPEYIKPSLKAMFPVSADTTWLIDQKCAGGGCVCDYTTNGAKYCIKCKYIGCPDKEGQTVPPSEITEADKKNRSYPAYCGNCGGGPCDYDGRNCL